MSVHFRCMQHPKEIFDSSEGDRLAFHLATEHEHQADLRIIVAGEE